MSASLTKDQKTVAVGSLLAGFLFLVWRRAQAKKTPTGIVTVGPITVTELPLTEVDKRFVPLRDKFWKTLHVTRDERTNGRNDEDFLQGWNRPTKAPTAAEVYLAQNILADAEKVAGHQAVMREILADARNFPLRQQIETLLSVGPDPIIDREAFPKPIGPHRTPTPAEVAILESLIRRERDFGQTHQAEWDAMLLSRALHPETEDETA